MVRQDSEMSDTISGILLAPSLPSWPGAFGPSCRWASLFHPPAGRSFQLPAEVEGLVGGLLLPHFPLQNAATPQLHTPGVSCCSPLPKDTDPFAGRGETFWVELQAGEQVRR